MALPLMKPRTVWLPTRLGWVLLTLIFGGTALLWFFQAESFLSQTRREAADVLVVEGWIDIDGIRAAKVEFEQGGYRYLIATGGLTGESWNRRRWSYAQEAAELLVQLGIPAERVLLATPRDVQAQRTFASAAAVWQALHDKGIKPASINVFTSGVHARRSRLVYAKVQGPAMRVGIIAWTPPGLFAEPWWRSSSRTMSLTKETFGYAFELLLNSGRFSNAPDQLPSGQ